jgi:hypothetical protein
VKLGTERGRKAVVPYPYGLARQWEMSAETVATPAAFPQVAAAAPTSSLQAPSAVRGSEIYRPTASGPSSGPVGLARGMFLFSRLRHSLRSAVRNVRVERAVR